MTDILAYLAPMIVFVAGFIGLLGPKREGPATGLHAITAFGWVSVGLAAVSLIATLYFVYDRQTRLAAAQEEKQKFRLLARQEIGTGLTELELVLRFLALIPATTNAQNAPDNPKLQTYLDGGIPDLARIDLADTETITDLQRTYYSPVTRLMGPYVPSAVPFGTDSRPVFDILETKSIASAEKIESAVRKYSAVSASAEIFDVSASLQRSAFLTYLASLHLNYANRARIEDANDPEILGFTVLDSGVTGGGTQDYLHLVEDIARFRAALQTGE